MDTAEISRRIAYVRTDFALSSAFEARWVAPDVWDRPAFIQGAGQHFGMGISRPVRGEAEGDRDIVFACAEVLVAQTEDMTEQEFFSYVALLRTHLHLHMLEEAAGHRGEALEEAVMERQHGVMNSDLFDRVWARLVR